VPGQPGHRRVQAGREEQREADEDQHGPDVDDQLDQGDGDRHAGRRGHADEERRAAVKRPSRRAEPAGFLG